MKRIYISGPITGTTDYKERFGKVEELLKGKGYEVLNPAVLNEILPVTTQYEEYMSMSYCMLDMCDSIYMMPGWEKSMGANRELGYALAKKKRVIKEIKEKPIDDLREYVCDHLCVHAAEDSDCLEVRCEECRLKEMKE